MEYKTTIDCNGCDREIPPMQPFVTVAYHVEHTVPDECFLVVEEAESLFTVCIDCAPPKASIVEALKAAGMPA